MSVADLLQALVRIDSVNPSLVPGAAGEAEVAAFIAAWLGERGFVVYLDEAAPGRATVTAVLPGTDRDRAPGLVLCGHTDTVGTANMTAPPFEGRIEGDRVYGRGAVDMKAGVAAILSAAETIARRGALPGDLVLGLVADEEYASIGVEQFVSLLPGRGLHPAAGIITEPTGLSLVHAHKGFAWGRITTEGRGAHGSAYAQGVDAIALMGRVISRIERLDRDLLTERTHPLLGRASVHCSLISGGVELSTYPDRCTLEIERRMLPGESDAAVRAEMEGILADLRAEGDDFRATYEQFFTRLPLEVPEDSPIVRVLDAAAAQELGASPLHLGMAGWADTQVLAAAGIPSVMLGPGESADPTGDRLALAHAAVEYASITSTECCARILVDAATRFCQVAE